MPKRRKTPPDAPSGAPVETGEIHVNETARVSETVQTTFELTEPFDVSGAVTLRETALDWLEQLPKNQPCKIILPDCDSALTVQIAAALHRSANARGLAVSLEDPSGAAVENIILAHPTGDAA